jgi:hypothetical protein
MTSTPNMTVQLRKLSLFCAYTSMTVNVRKCCITGALWHSCNALSLANRTLLASRLQTHFITINSRPSPIPSIGPSDTYRVLGVELNTSSPSPSNDMNYGALHHHCQCPFHLPANTVPQNTRHPRPSNRQALHPPARPLQRLPTRHSRRKNLPSIPLRHLLGA